VEDVCDTVKKKVCQSKESLTSKLDFLDFSENVWFNNSLNPQPFINKINLNTVYK